MMTSFPQNELRGFASVEEQAPWSGPAQPGANLIEEEPMDQDPIPGEAERAKGSVKEAIGKLTGDTKAQVEGAAEKAVGKPEKDAAGTEGKFPGNAENRT